MIFRNADSAILEVAYLELSLRTRGRFLWPSVIKPRDMETFSPLHRRQIDAGLAAVDRRGYARKGKAASIAALAALTA